MPKVKPLSENKYEINKHRFYELYHFCMQYNDWKTELKNINSTVKSPRLSGGGTSHGGEDQTLKLANRRMLLQEKCEAIEQSAIEADADLYPYILIGVTNEYATYKYLKTVEHIPCGKDMYYDRRRKFYYLLSKKI